MWVFKREVGNQVATHSTYDEWSDGLLAMLVWMQSHPEETRSVLSSLGMEESRSSSTSSCTPSWNPSSTS